LHNIYLHDAVFFRLRQLPARFGSVFVAVLQPAAALPRLERRWPARDPVARGPQLQLDGGRADAEGHTQEPRCRGRPALRPAGARERVGNRRDVAPAAAANGR